jgi:hypothetical protein
LTGTVVSTGRDVGAARTVLFSWLSLVAVACANVGGTSSNGPVRVAVSDEYQVYQVVLRFEAGRSWEERAKGIILARDLTSHPKPNEPEGDEFIGDAKPPSEEAQLDREFISAYHSVLQLPAARIDSQQMQLPKYVQLRDASDTRSKQMRLVFSRVGFDADHERAVMFVGVFCGVLCGGGEIIELRRARNNWSIVRRIRTWAS